MDTMRVEEHRALETILRQAETASPSGLPELVGEVAARLGIENVTLYLADVQQEVLIPLPDATTAEQPVFPIDHSMPGWAYRTSSPRVVEAESGGMDVWVPMQDGIERVGVLGVRCASVDAPRLRFCRALALLLTLIVLSKGAHSDTFVRLQRTRPMDLPAEMVWAFLPPRTLKTPDVTSSAMMEPAYRIGGDAFDHTLIDETFHAAILDAMGHDLRAGLTSAVALAGCRNARRDGADLDELTCPVDRAIADAFPERYCTGIFLHIDTRTGLLTWTNQGHLPPLLIRAQRVVPGALEREPELPLGWNRLNDQPPTVHREQLKPGDQVLLYTDGITEARTPAGTRFGLDTFTEFLIRATAAGEPAHESLRRLIHAILEHHEGQLTDDAMIMLIEWHHG
ncbi:PP2C family protein-serine/threonine phosphatase [Streptomyces zhihengii]|uniref:Serine/threonine-protein phosphatase n=1 Tax=Streptomyces zhihengii TaxID=1818004 RepID=A0ABS2V270_9ACTN|nr:PP2C family protein-serine/threonine phosphatase [Streptomyces zhihengii]MBM9623921.1 serine/threonine-protein phosphatase [Streptomyces zhihengii]